MNDQKVELMAALPERELRRVAVLVLGMHRAGSSAVTRFLNFLGCTLPHTLLDANPTNPAGHWESDAVRAFNDDMLAEAGSSWADWLPMHADWAKSQTYRHNLDAAGEVLDAEFGNAALFVLKDPRICRLADFWYEVLAQRNIDIVTLIPLRNPLEVAASLCKRDRMDPSIGQLLWLRHVLDAEFASRGHRRMFTHYEELLDNWSGLADRVGKGLEIVWPRSKSAFAADAASFLSHDLRHHVRQPADIVENAVHSRWLRDTYAILLRWIRHGEDDDGRVQLDVIREAFNENGQNFVPVVTALNTAHREIDDIGRDRHGLALRVIELTQAIDDAQAEELLAASTLEDELVAIRDRLAEATGTLASTQASLEHATRTVALLEVDVQSTREELAQAVYAHTEKDDLLTASGERIAALNADLDQARHRMKEADLRLDSLGMRITQADAETLRWQTTVEQLNAERQMDHQKIESLRESLKRKSSDWDIQVQRHEQEIATLHSEMQTFVASNADLSMRHAQTIERANSLADQLQEAQAHIVLQHDQVRFLRETLRILASPGRWWLSLMPAVWAKAFKDKILQRKGLFDADRYRHHNPDVADAGSDPLLHYVSHGLEEGRLRT